MTLTKMKLANGGTMIYDFWSGLTQPQATLLLGLLNSIIVPLVLFLWGALKFRALNGEIADTQKENKQIAAEVLDNDAPAVVAAVPTWNDLRDQWARVRKRLMDIAFDPSVDGRTRAAYGRIDLRGEGYRRFVEKLASDGQLGQSNADFLNAVELWNAYRNNRREVPLDAINKMKDIADRVG